MKKILTLVLCLLLAICCVAVLSACDDDTHEHTYAQDWQYDESYHWHSATCEHINERSDYYAHVYDGSGKCTVCEYQPPIEEHQHTFAKIWECDEEYHWHPATCEHTAEVGDKVRHDFDGDGVCTVCQYQQTIEKHEHSFATDWSFDETDHWHSATCEHTSEVNNKSVHAFEWVSRNDGGHSSMCPVCGYGFSGQHNYGEDGVCKDCGYQAVEAHWHDYVWSEELGDKDGNGHGLYCSCGDETWQQHLYCEDGRTCSVCGYVHYHVLDPSTAEYNTVWHYGECTDPMCPDFGAVAQKHIWGENNGDCVICGAPFHAHNWHWEEEYSVWSPRITIYTHMLICAPDCQFGELEEHDFSNGDTCSVCQYQRHAHRFVINANHDVDEDRHAGHCGICFLEYVGDHEWDGDKCTVCGYTVHEHEFVYNGFAGIFVPNHEGYCRICNKKTIGEHDFDGADSICSVCGIKNHEHQPNGDVVPNTNGLFYEHFYKCECGAIVDYGYHNWDDEVGACTECEKHYHEHDFRWVEDLADATYLSHKFYCECGTYEWRDHIYSNDKDEYCNVCNAPRHHHKWMLNEISVLYHTLHCAICGSDYDEEHIFEVNPDFCDVCGAERHEHNPSGYERWSGLEHTFYCPDCDNMYWEEHEYDGDDDTTCDKCGSQRIK